MYIHNDTDNNNNNNNDTGHDQAVKQSNIPSIYAIVVVVAGAFTTINTTAVNDSQL